VGKEMILVIVECFDDAMVFEIVFIENLQREDLLLFDEVVIY